MAPSTVELQPSNREAMTLTAQPAQAIDAANKQQESNDVEAQRKPRLQMRGGGIILDMCACFICFEGCKDCCEAIDDCCCC